MRPKSALTSVGLVLLTLAAPRLLSSQGSRSSPILRAEPNDQRTPAGHMVHGELRVDLEVVRAAWYTRGADGPRIVTPAFAEVEHAPQVPGPLLRASAGTPVHVTIHNTLDRAIAVRGLLDRAAMPPVHRPPALALAALPAFAFARPLVIAPGETGEATFTPTEAVSSFYYATTLPPDAPPPAVIASAVQPLSEGALMGALVVDPRGSPPPKGERVLMITRWNGPGENDTWKMMVNGESWPFTEHLQYTVGDTVRWRVINASDIDHPMHLHGFYFAVHALGDTQRDTLFTTDPPHVVTQMMQEFSSMRVSWVASRPGDWLFHCHLIQHIGESQHLAAERVAQAGAHDHSAESDEDPMAGLIVGITIHPAPGTRVADEPPVRTIELWTGRRPNVYGDAPELGFVIQQGTTPPPPDSTRVPGTPLILTRGQPTAIVIHNRLRFPFSVHWHGLEIRSLYDGVPGWSGMPGATMPPIAPGDSVRVILTQPRAGTFIYHTHGEPGYQLAQGLYGPLLVLSPGETWDRAHDRIFTLASRGATRDAAPAINGRVWPAPQRFDVGSTYRLRFIQISADEFKRIRLLRDGKPVEWRPIAKDGRDLPASRSRLGAAITGMGVGETRDFAWTPREPGVYVLEVTTEFYPRLGGSAVQRMAFGVGDVSDAELRRAQQPAVRIAALSAAERARYIGTFVGRPDAPGAPELVVRIWEENHELHGSLPVPKPAASAAPSGRLLAIGENLLAVGRDLHGLAHLYGPQYRFSGSGETLEHLDVEDKGRVLVRLTRTSEDAVPESGPHSMRHPLGARGVVGRVMSIRPRFPDGFGSPPPSVHPAVVRPGLFAYSPPIREVVSPATDRLAGTNAAGDLYVRAAGSEEKRIIARAEAPWRWDVEGAAWSPDGRCIAVKRIDDHEVPRIPIVDWTGAHETVKLVPYSRVGEPLPKEQVTIVDVASGRATPVQHGFDDPYVHILGWSADGRSLRLLRADRLLHHLDLLSADATTGAVTPILRERSSTFIVGLKFLNGYESELDSLHLAWFLDTRREFLWTSERTGFRHIYLYSAVGKLVRPLTTTLPGLVHRIVGVDEQRGWVYFTASTDTLHPYRQQLYRVSLAGGEPRELTEAGTISRVELSRSMDSIAVLRSRIPDLLEVDVLDANGASAHTFWKADLGFLKESGVAPEIAWSVAADGKTHLRSMLFKPAGFDPGKRYPVIEFIYAGAHQRFIPDTLQDPWFWVMHRLAGEGFVIVVTDSRGTPGRGKAFQDFAYGRIGQVEIADHAAVLRELARKRPYMDLSRVGVLGHSTGGYFALRALLLEPTLYRVAHISAGALDLPRFRVWVEPYMGCLPADCPDAYTKGRNTTLLPRLAGRLSINQGTADRDVPFADAMKLVQALEASGKDFELTVYPGATHTVMTAPRWAPRMVEFFRRCLSGGESTQAHAAITGR